MFATSKLAVLFPIVSAVFASPLVDLDSRGWQCKPNFQGNPVSIFVVDPKYFVTGDIYEWYAKNHNGSPITLDSQYAQQGFEEGEFFIEFTGQPEQTHRIKLTADSSRDLVATVTSSNDLVFSKTIWGDKSQNFSIDCNRCTDDSRATRCRISHPTTGQCVTYHGGHLEGQRLKLVPCGSGVKTFNIIPQLSAEKAAAVHVEEYR